ncbi:MAG: hypothetical protein CVV05_07115 [Gammaproteobacteria bacterium HGW-Gammaproteobacteria-1]|jgi:hypothetical protein|nr:MAG: hypothetical protein CVV05_07115 [Gammaproteobacteria bacterium HGW-Gammaproteobacteria-1]
MTPASTRLLFIQRTAALLLSTLLLLASPVLRAASFDCGKAASAIEKTICGDQTLSELDGKLGSLYNDVIAGMSGQDAEKVKSLQWVWIQTRDRCNDNKCLTDSYNKRIDELNGLYQQVIYAGKDVEVTSALEQSYDNAASVVIRFNVPVDRNADFRRHLEISTETTTLPANNWLINDDGFLAIYPFIEPSTKYTVKVKPGLKAINGRSHSGNREFTITSRRSEPSASFAGGGEVMSTKMKRALPVTTLNVDEVDLDFFHIAPDEIPAWSQFSGSQRNNYYRMNAFSEKHPLAFSARFPIKHRRNQRTTTNLDLSNIPALAGSGAYLAVLRVPGKYTYDYETNFFTVSDIGIQVRRTVKGMHVFSNSVTSGKALTGVEISLFKGNDLKASQTTGKDGIASFSNWFEETSTLIARSGSDYTVLRLDQPLDLSGISNAIARFQEMQLFAWGPRDLYRPGELIETYAILRDHDGRPLRGMPVRASLYDATGSQAANATLNRDDSGTYHFTHQMTDTAKPGEWKLIYSNPGNNEVLSEYKFAVEEFMPERMEISLYDGDPLRRRLFHDANTLTIPLSGKYLYGAPASGNRVDGNLLAELDRHPFEQWKSYSFGVDGEEIPTPRVTLPAINLDGDGAGEWSIDLGNWKGVASPLALTSTASLYESGGRPVTRSFSATRITQKQLVGIEPQFSKQADNNSRAGFKLVLTDSQGQPQSGSYQYVLIQEDRNYYWTYSDSSGWSWHYDPMEYESFSGKLKFSADKPVSIAVPVKWGNYRLEVRDGSNQIVSSYRFRTRWYWWGNSADGNALKPDQVNLGFREDSYQAGDTAHLLLSPATAGLATITVENNDTVLWVSQRSVAAEKTVIDIPVNSDWSRHDIYVTATILSPGDMKHSVAPKRAFGFVNLPLRRSDAGFDVSIEVPEKIAPEQKVAAVVRLTGGNGTIPDNTYVTLAAVDVGVLNITRYKTPDPVAYLFSPRRYEANLYDVYGQIIENAGFNYSQYRFGGDFAESEAELSRGGDKPKNDVRIVSLQSAPVRVGKDGRATVTMDIPQFNGKLRWMAIAWSDQTFGSAEANTTVADKLVTQLSKPRFLAVDDKSELTLDLSNMSGAPQQLSVAMSSGGALAAQVWDEQVALDDGKKQTLRFPITAAAVGDGLIELTVSNNRQGNEAIALQRNWTLGVRYAYPAVTRKEMTVINPGEAWRPTVDIADLAQASVQGQLILSNQPPIDVNSQFRHLLHYPYGCTEQSTSSGYPWVLVDLDAAQRMDLLPLIRSEFKTDYTEAFRKEQIEKAVKRLLPRQNSSGGFTLWDGNGDELSWLTVYVADFLTDAKMTGAEVDGDAVNKALNRLGEYLREQAPIAQRWSSDAKVYNFASRAYAAYVLAKVNRTNLSDLRRLYDAVDGKFDDSPLPWAQLGFALDKQGDATRAKAAYDKARQLKFAERYVGYYDSNLRDLSLTYAILASRGEARADMLLQLFDLTRQRPWLSTQERNALFKAALASKTAGGEKLLALIETKKNRQSIAQEKPFKTILGFDQLDSIQSISANENTVYASLEIIGNQAGVPAPSGDGFTIRRDYFDIDGKPLDLKSLKGGELVVVRLVVTASKYTPDGLVVDLLPAGLELENQNLANASVDLSKVAVDGQQLADWRDKAEVVHVEYRDDRFVAALAVEEYGSRDLFYLARAVTPGEYRVPPPYVEDMYRPYHHAVGATVETLRISK